MKLEELALDNAFEGSRVEVGRFSDELTFLYGENASGKTHAAKLLRQLLLGDPTGTTVGSAVVTRQGDSFRIQRNAIGEAVSVTSLNPGYRQLPLSSREHVVGLVESSVYDAVFNVSFRRTPELAARLARVLVDSLQVTEAIAAGQPDRSAELAAAQDRLKMIDAQLATLEYELQRQDQAGKTHHQRQELAVVDARADLQEVLGQLDDLATTNDQSTLGEIEAELSRLQLQIDEEMNQERSAKVTINPDRYALLYQRLDLVEDQIRRWRQLQGEVQRQRIRLRDQMQVWNELTLENESHPYHVARELLVQLEGKVDVAERNARHWASAGGARVDHDQIARTLGQLCQSMRDDLHGLCDELGQQYKQLRHRSAALELKHLRHCYAEMGQALERLVQQRTSAINELRLVDPAGAEAIIQADPEFARLARVHGLLEARKRWVSGEPLTTLPLTSTPDWAPTRARMDQLTRRRNQILQDAATRRDRGMQLEQRRDQLLQRIEELEGMLAPSSSVRLAQIEAQVESLRAQRADLVSRIDQLQPQVTRHPILQRADGLLQQATRGELIRVGLAPAGDDHWGLEVRTKGGSVKPWELLEPAAQDQTCLALMLAVKEYLKIQQGIELPTFIDDPFHRIQGDAISPTLDLLASFCRQGHQVVLLTQHRYLADRVPGATVLDLMAATREVDHTQVAPRVVPLRKSEWASENRFDDVSFGSPVATASPMPVESFGQPLEFAPCVDGETRLDQVPIFDVGHLQRFSDVGLHCVNDLLGLDLAGVEALGISGDRVDRWQSQLWLLMHVPGLRPQDARLLVACGLVEPQQLVTSHAQQLYERIHQYLATAAGQRSGLNRVGISLQRIEGWLRVLQENPDLWRQRVRRPVFSEAEISQTRRRALAPQQVTEGRDRRGRAPQVARAPRMQVHQPYPMSAEMPATPKATRPAHQEKPKSRRRSGVPQSATTKLKHYLELADHIEAVPSIGPKTAERFENIGVVTVDDFLKQTAESMATKLNYKRISAALIRRWQQQARLVCRVPNLRGHDAQLLVACDIIEPEDLASYQPQQLFEKVGPFCETKEGLKILRSGKAPDLEEVTNWIAWAGENRSLQAA